MSWTPGRPPAHAELLGRSRWYIAAPAGLIVTALVAVIAVGMYWSARQEAYGTLESRLRRIALEAKDLGEPGGYLVFDAGDHLLSSGPPALNDSAEGLQFVRDPRFGPLAVLTLPTTADGPHVVAVPARAELHALEVLRRTLAGLTLAAAVAAVLAGYALAGVAMRPLDHAMRDRGEFTALASHQLRTPLSVIRTSAELARAQLDVSPPEAFGVILEQARRIEGLTDRLTRLARAGALVRRPRGRVDLVAATREVLRPFQAAAGQAGVALVLEEAPSVWARADADALDDALAPVIDNAVKFSPRGGIVTVRVRRERRRVVVEIADSGPGIPPAELPHVTRPFFQGGGKRGGYGLGLAIAQSAAVRCGGRVVVTSHLGAGTVARIVLPAARVPRGERARSDQSPSLPPARA